MFCIPKDERKRGIVWDRVREEVAKMEQEYEVIFEKNLEEDSSRRQVRTTTGPHMVALKRLRDWSFRGVVPVYNEDLLPIWREGLSDSSWVEVQREVMREAGFDNGADTPGAQLHLERDPSRSEVQVFTRSTDEDERVAEALRVILPEKEVVPDENVSPCAVCHERERPFVKMSCGHSFCRPCLFFLLSSQEPPVHCVGDNDRCRTRWPCAEIMSKTYPALMERIMVRSVRAHVRTQPHLLFECPTGSCKNILQATTLVPSTGLQFCRGCAFVICTNCRAPNHPGRTCEAFQRATQQGLIFVDENNKIAEVKTCPGCGSMIERDDGCDHIFCPGCHTNFCFLCLAMFPDGRAVYEHLSAVHRAQEEGP